MDLKGQFRAILGQIGSKLTQNSQKHILGPRVPNKTTIPLNLKRWELFLIKKSRCKLFKVNFAPKTITNWPKMALQVPNGSKMYLNGLKRFKKTLRLEFLMKIHFQLFKLSGMLVLLDTLGLMMHFWPKMSLNWPCRAFLDIFILNSTQCLKLCVKVVFFHSLWPLFTYLAL